MKLKLFVCLLLGMFLVSSAFAAEYQLRRVSDLRIGDTIIDSEGGEIVIEKIEGQGKIQENFVYERSESLMNVLWGKIAGEELPAPIVSSGSNSLGLSLGESGVGVAISGNVIAEISKPVLDGKKSFWDKLKFWSRE